MRLIFLALVAVSVAGCGGSGGNQSSGAVSTAPSTSTPPPAPPTPKASSISDAINIAEQQKLVPVLNHDDTVAGPDSNSNGVRDDIDTYIASLTDTAAQKTALITYAAAIQGALLVDTTNVQALTGASNAILNSSTCLFSQYSADLASKNAAEIEKLTVDTMIRLQAYEVFNAAMSARMVTMPSGTGCDV